MNCIGVWVMKIVKRILSFVTAAGMLSTAAACFSFNGNDVNAASVVALSPNNKYEINKWLQSQGCFDGLSEKDSD